MFYLSALRDWWVTRQRDLFVYWDGTRRRRADPIRAAKAIEQACPDYRDKLLESVQDLAKVPVGPLRNDARERKSRAAEALVAASRQAFGLKPLTDADGVTDGEAVRVLVEFFSYMEGLANDAQVFPNSPGAG